MVEIKREDVDAVATKLQSFANTLPQQEKNVLSWLLSRAQASTAASEMSEEALEAVSGGQATSSHLAELLGFGEETPTVTVSTGWAK